MVSVELAQHSEEDCVFYSWREQDLREHIGPELLKTRGSGVDLCRWSLVGHLPEQ